MTRSTERLARLASRTMFGVLAMCGVAPALQAQWNVARFEESRHRLHTTAGIDPALITALGYSYVVPVLGRPVQLGVEGGVVATGNEANDFRTRLQAGMSVVQWKSMRMTASAAFVTRGTKNTIYKAVNMGTDLGTTIGIYRPHWFVAGETGYDKAIVTHMTHSDWYRNNYYADAKDGWYIDTGGTWRFGGAAGVSIGRTELTFRAGIPRTKHGNSIAVPYYASAGVGRAF